VLGMAIPFAVDPEVPTLRRWLDHFDHAVAVMAIAHVGLGADLIFIDGESPTVRREGADETPNAVTVAQEGARGS
jgi:microsomal dipeptidase-like Zn-dependent dipeptidase